MLRELFLNIAFALILFVNASNAEDINTEPTIKDHAGMRKILDTLVIGYDCSEPFNLVSHELDSAEKCQKEAQTITTKPEHMQILQRSNKIMVKAIS